MVRKLLCCIFFSWSLSTMSLAQNAPIDQPTWDIISSLVRTHIPRAFLYEVRVVNLSQVDLDTVDSKIRTSQPIPSTSQVFNAVNCTEQSQTWEREIKYISRVSSEVEFTKTVTTTEAVTVKASGTLFGYGIDATYENKEVVEVTNRTLQEFFDETEVKVMEQRVIPPGTRLYVRIVQREETTTIPLTGTGIIDAEIRVRIAGPFGYVTGWFWLSAGNVIPQPRFREVSLEGLTTTVVSDAIDVLYEEKPVPIGDQACLVDKAPNLASFIKH
jgi:hypothetical protein